MSAMIPVFSLIGARKAIGVCEHETFTRKGELTERGAGRLFLGAESTNFHEHFTHMGG
jgi:hypothetical protein